MSNTTNTNTTALPANLAADINAAHEAAFGRALEAIEQAFRCGELLLQVKQQAGHGRFLKWVKAHCRFSTRQAQRYMEAAENRAAIEAKYDAMSHLTLTGALRRLSKPKTDTVARAEPEPVTLDERVRIQIEAGSAMERFRQLTAELLAFADEVDVADAARSDTKFRQTLEAWHSVAASVLDTTVDLGHVVHVLRASEAVESKAKAMNKVTAFRRDEELARIGGRVTKSAVPKPGHWVTGACDGQTLHVAESQAHPGYYFITLIKHCPNGEADIEALRPCSAKGVEMFAPMMFPVDEAVLIETPGNPWPRNPWLDDAPEQAAA